MRGGWPLSCPYSISSTHLHPRPWEAPRLSCLNQRMKASGGPLFLAGTQCQGPNLCQLRRQEAAVYPSGSGQVICLCQQPFTQVSRGAAEGTRTSAFAPRNGAERPAVTLHFSRHPWSGKLVFLPQPRARCLGLLLQALFQSLALQSPSWRNTSLLLRRFGLQDVCVLRPHCQCFDSDSSCLVPCLHNWKSVCAWCCCPIMNAD